MIDALQDFTNGLPEVLRWFGIVVTAMIPFLEVEFAAVLGVISGQHVAIAVLAAVVGNVAVVALIVLVASRTRAGSRATARRRRRPGARRSAARSTATACRASASSARSWCRRTSRRPRWSPSARPRAVLIWETIAIAVWGVAFGALAVLGLTVV